MEEEKGFSSNPWGVAENNPRWALLHIYGLLKIPKICFDFFFFFFADEEKAKRAKINRDELYLVNVDLAGKETNGKGLSSKP